MELLRDRSAEFEEADVRVLGVSRDSPWSHVAWMQALDLNFPLLSDWNAAAVLAMWPAPQHLGSRFAAVARPVPGEAAAGDHLQAEYHLWLVGDQLRRGEKPWLDPYTFRPESTPRVNLGGWPFGLPYWPLVAVFGTLLAWNLFLLLTYLAAGGFPF